MGNPGDAGHLMRTSAAAALVATAIILGSATPATATTRGEFVAQAEALCRESNRVISNRSNQLYRRYKRLRPAGKPRDWSRAQKRRDEFLYFNGYGRVLSFEGRAIHTLNGQLQAVPEPADDASVIAQWIESRRVDAGLIKQSGRQLKRVSRRKPNGALGVLFRFQGVEDQLGLTDLIVGSFGFEQCYLTNEDP